MLDPFYGTLPNLSQEEVEQTIMQRNHLKGCIAVGIKSINTSHDLRQALVLSALAERR